MKIEGVTFVTSVVRSMTKEAFIKAHVNVYWTDRTKKERYKILSDAYDVITEL